MHGGSYSSIRGHVFFTEAFQFCRSSFVIDMPRRYIKKNCPKKYSDADLALALAAIIEGASTRQSSKQFHVPYATLHRHGCGELLHEGRGRPTKFSPVEESHLEQTAIALQVVVSYLYDRRINAVHLYRNGENH